MMIDITKEISFEEVLEKIEEAKNIGILALVFAIAFILILALCVWYFFQCDEYNSRIIKHLEEETAELREKYHHLEYKFSLYCDRAVYLPTDSKKEGKRK